MEREVDAMDRLTLAVAAGSGIAWGGAEAFEAWRSARTGRTPEAGKAAAAKQRASLARLSRLFPGAVTVKRAD